MKSKTSKTGRTATKRTVKRQGKKIQVKRQAAERCVHCGGMFKNDGDWKICVMCGRIEGHSCESCHFTTKGKNIAA